MVKVDPNNLLYRFYGWMWTLVVTLLVLAAIALTVVRLALPYAESYRTELEFSLSKSLGQTVTVGSMTAELNGLSPTLVLKDLTVFDSDEQNIQFKLSRMDIGFSIRKSLQEEKAIPNSLNLSGTELTIVREKELHYTVNGIPLNLDTKRKESATSYPPVLNWLFENASMSVDQVKLDYQDRITEKHIEFQATEIKLRNSGARHQIDGVILPPSKFAKQTGFSIDIEAEDMQDISSWKISTFAIAQGIDVERINEEFFSAERVNLKGLANIRLWSTWQGLTPVDFYGDINLSAVQLGSPNTQSPFAVEHANSRFRLHRETPSSWVLDVEHLELFDLENNRDPGRIRLTVNTETNTYEAKANLLYLQDIRNLIVALDFAGPEQREMLENMALSGELRDIHLNWKSFKDRPAAYDLAFRTKDLTSQAWKSFPRVKGLDSVVWMDENSGASMLSSSNMQLDIAHVFRFPWAINNLEGLLQWRKHNGSWHVMSERLAIDGDDVDMVTRMHLLLANKEHPGHLDLLAKFENFKVTELKRFYPVNVMGASLVSWLDRSLQDGHLQNGGVVYRGWLKKGAFPFRQKQGKFEVGFQTEKLTLSYLDKWPAFHDMQADVTFAAAGMKIETRSAIVQGMSVKSFTADIEEFSKPWLILNGQVDGNTAQALEYIKQSPLAESLSSQVHRVQAFGESELDLSMSIPLKKSLGKTRYRGELMLRESSIRSRFGDGELFAGSVNGRLLFTENGYYSDSIKSQVFSRPANLKVSTKRQGANKVVELKLTGRANASDLQDKLKIDLLDYLQGESNYTTRLLIYQGNRKETLFKINSDLQGMAINLPKPLHKSPASKQKFSALWNANIQQFQLSIDDKIHSTFWLDNSGDKTQLSRGDLHFGSDMPTIPDTDVLRLSGRLDDFPLSSWMSELARSKSSSSLSTKLPWEVDLDYMGVLAVKEVSAAVVQKASKPDLVSLPILRVKIKQLDYKDLKLGQFTLYADPFNSGYKIDALNFDGPLVTFSSKGYWYQGDNPLTALSIQVHARNAESLLSKVGFDSPIKGGDLQLDGDIQWPGSPDKFILTDAEGKLAFNIKNGRLINVEPGAGRVLGLLSFQALPRRLALDFRDLFGKGYRFDSIQGEFNIEDGNAYTSNMTILSPLARVYLSGRVGLQARDYEQDVIVIPGDGSNYFVAGALAGGIQTGVVVWVMEKVLDVEKYSQLVYKITGSWENPVVTSLNETPG